MTVGACGQSRARPPAGDPAADWGPALLGVHPLMPSPGRGCPQGTLRLTRGPGLCGGHLLMVSPGRGCPRGTLRLTWRPGLCGGHLLMGCGVTKLAGAQYLHHLLQEGQGGLLTALRLTPLSLTGLGLGVQMGISPQPPVEESAEASL